MNTAEIADHLAGAHGLTKSAAKALVDDVLKAIADAAAKGDEGSLPGCGKFKVQSPPGRTRAATRPPARRDQYRGVREKRPFSPASRP